MQRYIKTSRNVFTPLHTLVINVNSLVIYPAITFHLSVQIPTGVYRMEVSCLSIFHCKGILQYTLLCSILFFPLTICQGHPYTGCNSFLFFLTSLCLGLHSFTYLASHCSWWGVHFVISQLLHVVSFWMITSLGPWAARSSIIHHPGKLCFGSQAAWWMYKACWPPWGVTAWCAWPPCVSWAWGCYQESGPYGSPPCSSELGLPPWSSLITGYAGNIAGWSMRLENSFDGANQAA